MSIIIHSKQDYEGMNVAGSLATEVLDKVTEFIRPGITTNQINDFCHEYIVNAGAIPAPLNYKGFPKSVCTSKNSVVCHGIPDDNPLVDGDMLNIDVTVILDGWHGDTSRMYYIGKPSPLARALCDVTYDAMWAGIGVVKEGVLLCEIGKAIAKHIKQYKFSSVKDFCGHGIGKKFHTDPQVLHYENNDNTILKEGMFFTVEPMINRGKEHVLIKKDGWTAVTRDLSLSAQFEHTIAVTQTGCQVFTLSKEYSGRAVICG
ncbi:MAG: methionine aminopeptidase, type I [Candidatus Xenolissoclinum pacificiensis L6]|uniref:Methionine aminopeptidase n=1 Tax=Candidatus Xenolissoclinum pacificiensis L6 TaxID=1401685 RepID=W2V2G9_9RICK|nr:MAG: methionine aminopeptidase, type I [Candidatus Xenolissoclinum pacificiensis L6]